MAIAVNIYGDGLAAKRIKKIIEKLLAINMNILQSMTLMPTT